MDSAAAVVAQPDELHDAAATALLPEVLLRPQPPCDWRLPYGWHPSQFGELRLPAGPGPFPVVVGIHGGWWRAAHGLETHAHLCAALTRLGYATWNIEYRRVGEAGGGWPGTLQDVGAALDYLAVIAAEFNLDLARVVPVGFSAGGQLALWAAARAAFAAGHPLHEATPLPVSAAVALAGAVDLARCAELQLSKGIVAAFLGGDPAAVPERFAAASPAQLPIAVPHTLVHGSADSSVPVEISQRYHAAATARGAACELVVLPGVEHFDLIDPLSPAWPAVARAIHDRLGPPATS
ncbi:alpha/beta hydrolase [Pseudoduganella chitinolytica]|uniref:Alpha/beta hydrolase n=1 Tax=Pseudoduganella chitinolytica TaxID=34070 RepID=A0ABY8B9X6_9BURK|nr:alpha/beta hydrolase [Pseudoduganella chitinolytica]WEF31552.1 alpha/beta hydrolase [Pseudoduganella chitinolytica]